MYLVGGSGSVRSKHRAKVAGASRTIIEAESVGTAASLVSNLVEMACEHAPDLDLARLVNFMELYRVYVENVSDPHSQFYSEFRRASVPGNAVLTPRLGSTTLLSFECFVRDSRLLSIASKASSLEAGESVAVPAPLRVSANS